MSAYHQSVGFWVDARIQNCNCNTITVVTRMLFQKLNHARLMFWHQKITWKFAINNSTRHDWCSLINCCCYCWCRYSGCQTQQKFYSPNDRPYTSLTFQRILKVLYDVEMFCCIQIHAREKEIDGCKWDILMFPCYFFSARNSVLFEILFIFFIWKFHVMCFEFIKKNSTNAI